MGNGGETIKNMVGQGLWHIYAMALSEIAYPHKNGYCECSETQTSAKWQQNAFYMNFSCAGMAWQSSIKCKFTFLHFLSFSWAFLFFSQLHFTFFFENSFGARSQSTYK